MGEDLAMPEETAQGARPADLLLTAMGAFFMIRPSVEVPTETLIDILGRLGVAEYAARATCNRMVDRGLLQRRREGRRAVYSLTAGSRRLIEDGTPRIVDFEPCRTDWDATWTLLSFSIPEARRAKRHQLRVRLAWRGFGRLRDGVWLAPGPVAVRGLLAELGLDRHARAFVGAAIDPTDLDEVIHSAWDVEALVEGYTAFARRWNGGYADGLADDLVRVTRLLTEWRLVIRDDPRLPCELLPEGWPGLDANETFRRLYRRYDPPAQALFDAALAEV
ncbi:MAG: PaaX family transcriptional regulator [Streptosporangiales bacterium]|nr:PaaX family transcriptional regulator [Streptosporangiales bacterium]